MKSTVRAFIAVEIAQNIRTAAQKALRPIKHSFPNVKWVEDENFHVTLKFLGPNVPTSELHRLIRAVEKACAKVEQFDLVFEGMGAFPDSAHPRTIWLGVSEGVDELKELAGRIEDELELLGFPKEGRDFSPHMTVGRTRQRDRDGDESFDNLSKMIEERSEVFFGCSPVDSVVIYSSELERNGPKYMPLATIELSPFGAELNEKYAAFNPNDYDDADFPIDKGAMEECFPETIDSKFDVEALDAEVEDELRAICGNKFVKRPKKFNAAPIGGKHNIEEQKKRLNAAKQEEIDVDDLNFDLSEFKDFRDVKKKRR
ncbi:MAG: RNA 2',3'-cyclic phosphodiesterase [Thermoguttaceae bacterium]|nr:RNA 2',3'-cyclic phosphodiesterase [Thermoguttaceae bacterium]